MVHGASFELFQQNTSQCVCVLSQRRLCFIAAKIQFHMYSCQNWESANCSSFANCNSDVLQLFFTCGQPAKDLMIIKQASEKTIATLYLIELSSSVRLLYRKCINSEAQPLTGCLSLSS